jgi:acyl-CoA dehydrogenase
MIGRFCEAEVDPFYDQWERDEILPRDIWHKLGAAGFLCVDIPEAYGGTSEIMQELVARAVLDS